MIEQHMDIPGADGAMNSFMVCPEEGGPPKRAGIYHQAAAERHWERLLDLFRRTLQA
jgi:carboxymethylenebutenolidase